MRFRGATENSVLSSVTSSAACNTIWLHKNPSFPLEALSRIPRAHVGNKYSQVT